jgi:hypothetical protein
MKAQGVLWMADASTCSSLHNSAVVLTPPIESSLMYNWGAYGDSATLCHFGGVRCVMQLLQIGC